MFSKRNIDNNYKLRGILKDLLWLPYLIFPPKQLWKQSLGSKKQMLCCNMKIALLLIRTNVIVS